jgi:hypothetical protein
MAEKLEKDKRSRVHVICDRTKPRNILSSSLQVLRGKKLEWFLYLIGLIQYLEQLLNPALHDRHSVGREVSIIPESKLSLPRGLSEIK